MVSILASTGHSPGADAAIEALPGNFCVWAASPAAVFLHGRFVWVNWDVDELVARKKEFEEDPGVLKIGLQACEHVDITTLFSKIVENEKRQAAM